MSISLYFHIPFCRHRCAYCDFNTYAGQEASLSAYVQALRSEIQAAAGEASLSVGTIFFGGGTPSLLNPSQFSEIFQTLRACFEIEPQAEISLEANPGTLTRPALQSLREIGFNRISLGVQSANPRELRLLERIHDFPEVIRAFTWARQAGFENINLDLMYGLPEQTLSDWQRTLNLTAALQPEHFSAYALTLEHGTPFGRWANQGLLPIPDPDLAADMAEWAAEFFAGRGYEQYEISNWARPGRECRHNLQYWRNLPYLGLGAGAHGFAGGLRYSNVLRIKTYIDRLAAGGSRRWPLTPAAVNALTIDRDTEMDETMLTGLRLVREGVSDEQFFVRFGARLEDVYGREIDDLLRLGLLEWAGTSLRLTKRGWLLGNQVFAHFLRETPPTDGVKPSGRG